jgi:hypothetical protein
MLLRVLQILLLFAFVRFVVLAFRAATRLGGTEGHAGRSVPRGPAGSRVIDVDYTEKKRSR